MPVLGIAEMPVLGIAEMPVLGIVVDLCTSVNTGINFFKNGDIMSAVSLLSTLPCIKSPKHTYSMVLY